MDTTEKKNQRFRSVAYPSYTIQDSVELTRKINQLFGNSSYNKREDLAQELDMSVGNLLMKLSTATQYGLLEMKSGEGYKPTHLFTSIYKPLTEEEKSKSELECLYKPELYSKLIEHYKGKQLPAIGGLSILLFRSYKVSEDASNRAAKIFLQNLSDLNLVDEENRLKIDLENEIPPTDENVKVEIPTMLPQPKPQINYTESIQDIGHQLVSTAPPIPIFLKGEGRIAKLLLPLDFTNDDIDYIKKVLDVYKRPE
jgi:hypothetical protein